MIARLTTDQKARARRHIASCREQLAAARRRLDTRDARTIAATKTGLDGLGRASTKAADR